MTSSHALLHTEPGLFLMEVLLWNRVGGEAGGMSLDAEQKCEGIKIFLTPWAPEFVALQRHLVLVK